MQPLRTTKEAADYLRISASSLERFRSAGTGPAYTRAGKRVIYRQEDLDAWLAERTTRPTGSAAE